MDIRFRIEINIQSGEGLGSFDDSEEDDDDDDEADDSDDDDTESSSDDVTDEIDEFEYNNQNANRIRLSLGLY